MADRRVLDADPRFRDGVERFNDRAYFDAHEVWEDLWREEQHDDTRRFVQALIQIAAAYHHVQRGDALHRGSLRGASRLFHKALGRLEAPFAPGVVPEYFDLAALVAAVTRDTDAIDRALDAKPDTSAVTLPDPPVLATL